MKKVCFRWLCALLILGLPLAVLAADPPNYGFVPNIGDATVSKVDLISNTTVARYYTTPRQGQVIDATMAAIFGVPAGAFPILPADWRTSRIAMDPDGNAWVINTGADCFASGTPKYAFPIQGTVVRILGDPTGLVNTSGGHSDILTFGTDEAVEVYAVGATNDIPRTVNFDLDGNLWIGFHMAAPKEWGYFQKYTYDKCLKTLTPEGAPVTSTAYDIAPYNGSVDKNGVLWFSSYGSTRVGRFTGAYAAMHGMYSFDTIGPGAITFYPGLTTAYGVLVDNTPADPHVKVYATSLEGGAQMWVWDSTIGGPFMPISVPDASGLRSMAFDKYGRIWMASSNNGLVFWYNPALSTTGHSGTLGNTPVGVGRDDAGDMWVVVRDSDKLITFTPPTPPVEPVNGFTTFTNVPVGPQPYAYGDFTRIPVYYQICGYKYKAGTSPKLGLEGWTINLYKKDGGSFPTTPTATVETDASGHYCFTNLVAGVYKVTETLKPNWHQVYPVTNEYIITLPDYDPCKEEPNSYDFENTQTVCFDETAWAANVGPGTIRFLPERGNWATYARYTFGSGTSSAPKEFQLFAGQTYFVGNLLVYDVGEDLYMKYDVEPAGDPEQNYKPGYCAAGGWELFEYHFQVVDEVAGFAPFLTKSGNPIPGQFMNNGQDVGDGWFRVSIKKFGNTDAFIAAHAVVQWCGYLCDWGERRR
ncbi:MAG: SpaA isopeptide-forming pilin-related protein [Candidatus Aminicenantes bacterium]|nr:SpaA isopeptide-forming pilin-related protein [Candidatus Aminicenantes bacterium]